MAATIDQIKRIVSLQLGIRTVGERDRFMADLGAESVDVMNIIVAVEEKFGVEIKESEIPNLLTVAALHEFVNRQTHA